ncbi:MAG: class I SAM-dependent methyltransferase [Planctomycetaceae bacterium]|nr:class I SAM-dependent methyltransferase [Planctomycetaceae bacterium]
MSQNAAEYTNHVCPVCRAEHPRILGEGTLAECRQCEFVYARKIPDLDVLKQRQAAHPRNHCGDFHSQRRLARRFKYWAFSKVIQCCCRKQPVIHTLQLGCNEGLFLEAVEQNRRFRSTGLDWREKPVEYALTHGYDAHLTDLKTLDYPDDSFDFVFGLRAPVLLHNPEQLMLELVRILKPGGFLFTVMPGGSRQRPPESDPQQLWAFTPKTLSRFAERFELRTLRTLSFFRRGEVGLLARKGEAVDVASIPRWMGPEFGNPTSSRAA